MYLEMIVGVGIVVFALLYFSFKLDNDHILLKLLSIVVAFVLLILVPAFTNGAEETCNNEIINQTVAANVTTFAYEKVCFTTSSVSNNAFLNVYIGFVVILFLYMSVYVVIEAMRFMRESVGKV